MSSCLCPHECASRSSCRCAWRNRRRQRSPRYQVSSYILSLILLGFTSFSRALLIPRGLIHHAWHTSAKWPRLVKKQQHHHEPIQSKHFQTREDNRSPALFFGRQPNTAGGWAENDTLSDSVGTSVSPSSDNKVPDADSTSDKRKDEDSSVRLLLEEERLLTELEGKVERALLLEGRKGDRNSATMSTRGNEDEAESSTLTDDPNLLLDMTSGSWGWIPRPSVSFATSSSSDTTNDAVDISNKAENPESSQGKSLPEEVLLTPAVMDKDMAIELDDSVTTFSTGFINNDVRRPSGVETVFPLSDWYASSARSITDETATASVPALPPLSRPQHYDYHIGRDMRRLAVSIASAVETVEQWQLFCEEHGGVRPLLECIRDGRHPSDSNNMRAKPLTPPWSRKRRRPFAGSTNPLASSSNFEVAYAACRTLRDLCALSESMAVVITDEILRANTEWSLSSSSSLLDDFVNLLYHQDHHGLLFGRSGNERDLDHVARSKMHVVQLLLEMAMASDLAIDTMRVTDGLMEAVRSYSSHVGVIDKQAQPVPPTSSRRSMIDKCVVLLKKLGLPRLFQRSPNSTSSQNNPSGVHSPQRRGLSKELEGTANRLLAALGVNQWVPKRPGQKGLRILSLDGGGSRGIVAAAQLKSLVKAVGDLELCDTFDIIGGTSTGAIIAFLLGLLRESAEEVSERYKKLIQRIFVQDHPLQQAAMILTTAQYNEKHILNVFTGILGEKLMLDSRSDPKVPYVFGVSSKMSSNPTHLTLFRNYNYNGDEMPDPFTLDPDEERANLGLRVEFETLPASPNPEHKEKLKKRRVFGTKMSRNASRHPGSFRIMQSTALRASTAAPTIFLPVKLNGEMYCDGGIVASNPAAVAMHEASTLFPDVPIELIVSVGTGGYLEEKTEPSGGWGDILMQIANSACDAELTHHVLEDLHGHDGLNHRGSSCSNRVTTKYFRLNPVIGKPNDFRIDETDRDELDKMIKLGEDYMEEPEQQVRLQEISAILHGKEEQSRPGWKRWFRS